MEINQKSAWQRTYGVYISPSIPLSLRTRARQCDPLCTMRHARLLWTQVNDGTPVWKALRKSITRSSSSDEKNLTASALGLPILSKTIATMFLLTPIAWSRHRGRSRSEAGDKDGNRMRVQMITTTMTAGR